MLNIDSKQKPSQDNSPIFGQAILNNTLVKYLCDSGARRSLISLKLFNIIKKHDPQTLLETYTGNELFSCSGKIKIHGFLILKRFVILPEIKLNKVTLLVTENVTGHDFILGRDLVHKIPDFKKYFGEIKKTIKQMSSQVKKIFKEERKQCLKNSTSCSNLSSESSSSQSSISSSSSTECIEKNTELSEESWEEGKETNSQFSKIEEAREVVADELKQISAKSVIDLEPTINHDVAFEIEFIDPNQKPLRCKFRPLPYNLKEKVQNEIEQQIEAKIIRPSRSQWCSPIRVVDKPDGSIRITVDYKALNQLIKDDSYPLPSIQDLYNKLAEADTFTKIDMKVAYHQIPVNPNSIEITAFICEFGIFEYLTMPMGIKTAPAWFQRFIEKSLNKFIMNNTLRAYLDDIIVFTNSTKYGLNYRAKSS